MIFTDNQLSAITGEKNTVVTAGAGSGKTTVLAERFLWLARQKRTPVDRILTLTFTQKAAAEMYERIYGRLLAESENSRDPFLKEQIRNFDKAQISTLDSFCLTIAKNCPEMFGLPGNFNPSPETAVTQLEEFCLDFILQRQDNSALRELIRLHTFEGLLTKFFHPLAQSYFHLADTRNFEQMYEAQVALLNKRMDETIGLYRNIGESILGMEDGGLKSVQTCKDSLKAASADIVGSLLRDGYESCKLKKPGGRSNPVIDELKAYIDEYNKVLVIMESIGKTLSNRETLHMLFHLLTDFQSAFMEAKRSQGIVTFQDVQEMAVKILADLKDMRTFYKLSFDYILIDEFQDNNDLQKRLLFLLAEKRESFTENPQAADLTPDKLFFVGDEKQSIYRFRGADVSVFKALNREIELYGGLSIPLSVNYRSEPGIIDFINRVFERVFNAETGSGDADSHAAAESAKPDYEADFVPLKPIERRIPGNPLIKILYKPFSDRTGADNLSTDEAEAFALASFIHDAVSRKILPVFEGGEVRPAVYNDFALLMRSTSNQVLYERMFRRFGLPYATRQVRTLFLEAPFNDMFNILKLALFPDDRLAYAAFLRSPFVRVSDEGLLRILLAGEKTPFSLNTEQSRLIESDRKKFAKGKGLFEDIRSGIDKIPLKDNIFKLWYAYGYRYHILKNEMYHSYLDYYDYLALLAEQADKEGMCAAGFLEFLEVNLGKYERITDLEPLKESFRGVQLLSIHKSKGLQFPIVILANTGNMGRSENKAKAPFYVSGEYGLTVQFGKTENYFYTMSEQEADARELAEVKRLLYVACTRAQYHLIISGVHNSRNRNDDSCHINMLLKALSLHAGEGIPEVPPNAGFTLEAMPDISRKDSDAIRSSYKKADIDAILTLYEKKPAFTWQPPLPDCSAVSLNKVTASEGIPLPRYPFDDLLETEEEETAFGTLCHALLEQTLKGFDDAFNIPESYLLPFKKKHRRTLLSQAQALCGAALAKGLGDLVSSALRIETETSFTYCHRHTASDPPLFIHGRMDVFMETAEAAYIIDFKTDKYYSDGAYDIQLSVYAAAAAEFTEMPVRPCLCFLRTGNLSFIEAKTPEMWF